MYTFSGVKNWLLLYFSVKTKSSVCHNFLNICIIFASRSRWRSEYKPGSSPEPLALNAPLFTWSVQWLLLQCATALQRFMEQTLWSRLHWAHWYFTHFKLFYFPNIIGLVQRLVRFVMHTERKPCTERFNMNTCIVTPLKYICMHCNILYMFM